LKEIKQTLDIREGRLGDTGFRFIDYYELIELLAGDETITITVLPGAHNHPHNDLSTIQGGTTDEYYHLTLAEHGALGTIPDHNDLGAIQGGTATERYHLTAAEHGALGTHPDHNDLANIQGGSGSERYHLTAAEAGNLHAPNLIEQLNSKVEVLDAGTGSIKAYVDGGERLELLANSQTFGWILGESIEVQQASNWIKFKIGANDELIIDGTRIQLPTGLIETNTSAPLDLTIDCGTDKTIVLADTVWDDVKVTPGAFQFSGSGDPTLINWQPGGAGATFKIYAFSKNDNVFAVVQMPHKYKEGTDLEFHIHWTPHNRGIAESGNAVGWKVDYSISNINGTFPASSTADLSDLTTGTDDKHEITSSVVVSGTGLTISHVIMLRIYRSDTGADDTWSGVTAAQSPALLEMDIHFEIDTMGSRQNIVK